jgi:hypothetical protein
MVTVQDWRQDSVVHERVSQFRNSLRLLIHPDTIVPKSRLLHPKQNPQPQTTPTAPDNQLPIFSIELKFPFRDHKPVIVATPATPRPDVFPFVVSQIIEIDSVQSSAEDFVVVVVFRPRDLQAEVVF